MNKEIIKQVFPEMLEKIENGSCPMCGEKINIEDFKDPISIKEFKISDMCQKCQDKFFK